MGCTVAINDGSCSQSYASRQNASDKMDVEIYLALKVQKIRTRIIICYEEYHWVYMLE